MYASLKPGADEHVLDEAAQPLLAASGARRPTRRSGIVCGTRSSTTRATSSTTSISRVTSRARQVGTVTSQSSLDVEAEPLEDRALLVGRDVEADDPVRALGAQPDDRARGQARVHVGARPSSSAPARSTSRRLASTAAGSASVRVDALLPAVRALGAEAEPLGRAEDPDRLEVRGLEQHLGRLVARPRSPGRP